MTSPVIHHIGFSVRDIDRSADWYARLFDLALVAEVDEPAPMKVFMTPQGQALDLRQDPRVIDAPFTQERVGLDHVGFVCADRAELDAWRERLLAHDVVESGIDRVPLRVAPQLPRPRRHRPRVLPPRRTVTRDGSARDPNHPLGPWEARS